jgi:hypothetical protein
MASPKVLKFRELICELLVCFVPPNAKMQRPADQAGFFFISPGRKQCIPDKLKRVPSFLRLVSLRGRPAIQEARKLD